LLVNSRLRPLSYVTFRPEGRKGFLKTGFLGHRAKHMERYHPVRDLLADGKRKVAQHIRGGFFEKIKMFAI